MAARSSGQSVSGGIAAVDGSASRITPTGSRPLRSSTAFVKCVVPIMTASMSRAGAARGASTAPIALTIPPVTSAVVGVLCEATTSPSTTTTASVFVPPTSTPILVTMVGSFAVRLGAGNTFGG